MARYFRDEDERPKRTKQCFGHTQLKYRLFISRAKAEQRAANLEHETRELLSSTDKVNKRR